MLGQGFQCRTQWMWPEGGPQQGMCLGQRPLGGSYTPRAPFQDSCPILGAATDRGEAPEQATH